MKSSTLLLPLLPLLAAAIPNPSSSSHSLSARDFDINAFVKKIASYFPVNVALADICDAITTGEDALAGYFGLATSQSASSCADVALLFARGTCDPGNVGALVGPALVQELQDALAGKSLSVQGVEYPASVAGYLNDDPAGGQTMADLLKSTQSSCPNSKIVMAGYSQGGYVVHNAASASGGAMSSVSAVVIFGDPDSATPVAGIDASRVKVYCHDGDDICQQGDIILAQHLTYAIDTPDAASFIKAQLGL